MKAHALRVTELRRAAHPQAPVAIRGAKLAGVVNRARGACAADIEDYPEDERSSAATKRPPVVVQNHQSRLVLRAPNRRHGLGYCLFTPKVDESRSNVHQVASRRAVSLLAAYIAASARRKRASASVPSRGKTANPVLIRTLISQEPITMGSLRHSETRRRDAGSFVFGCLRQEDRELVTTEPRDRVPLSRGSSQPQGDLLHTCITCQVPVRIVYLLELVDIEYDDDEVLLPAWRPLECMS